MSKVPRLSQIAPLTPLQKKLARQFKLMEKHGVCIPRDHEVARIMSTDRSGYSITEMNLLARIMLWQVRDHYEDKVNVSDIDSKRLVSLAGYVKARGRGAMSTSWTGLHYLEWDKVHKHKDYEVKVPYELYVPVPVLGNLLALKSTLDYTKQLRSSIVTRWKSNQDYVNKLIQDGFEDHHTVTQHRKVEKDIEDLTPIIERYETEMTQKRKDEVTYYLRWLNQTLRKFEIEKFFLPVVVQKMVNGEVLLTEDYTTHIEMRDISELYK